MTKGLKVSYIPYFHNDMNDVAFSEKYNYRWSNYLKKMIEEDGGEIHTFDILPFEKADAILCFDNIYFQNNRFFLELFKCDKLGCTTHIEYEPPSANCKIHSDDGLLKLSNIFKSLITYNDNVINNDTIVKGCIGDFFSKEQKYNNDFKKRKLLTMITNNRTNLNLFERHPNELYSERKNAVAYFQEKCPNDFDLYGDNWPDDLKKCWVKKLTREEKAKYLSNYKFIISYDSICKQNGYISEKIFDCFNAKVVPVYWGADNVTDYIPQDCFIDRRKFSSYDELYDFLNKMTEKEYEKYIKAIEKYLKSNQYLELFSSEASARRIYKELCREKRILNKKKVKEILKEFEDKRLSSINYNFPNNCYDYHYPTITTLYNMKQINEPDYRLNFMLKMVLYSSKNYDIDIYYKNNKRKYYKIDSNVENYDTVYNGNKIEFEINLLEIQNMRGASLYTYDKKNRKYMPLNIESIVIMDWFYDYFKLDIIKNRFVYKYDKNEKRDYYLRKIHVSRILNKINRLK